MSDPLNRIADALEKMAAEAVKDPPDTAEYLLKRVFFWLRDEGREASLPHAMYDDIVAFFKEK